MHPLGESFRLEACDRWHTVLSAHSVGSARVLKKKSLLDDDAAYPHLPGPKHLIYHQKTRARSVRSAAQSEMWDWVFPFAKELCLWSGSLEISLPPAAKDVRSGRLQPQLPSQGDEFEIATWKYQISPAEPEYASPARRSRRGMTKRTLAWLQNQPAP